MNDRSGGVTAGASIQQGNSREPIAIVGIGCRFPGGANNPDKFWRLLKSGADVVGDIPSGRWNSERFYHSDSTKPGKLYIRKGGFLQERVDEFDPLFFGISPREALYIDPQQRMLLEVAWEALEDAGIVAKVLAGSDTGVYIGGFTLDSMVLQLSPLNRENINAHYGATAATMTMLANRLSYIFDFHGPSITVDTACSSSLVSLHYACQGIWNGECSLALAGGVNVMLSPGFPMVMCKGHFLAPDGHCKSFDARADGYGRGEGCGIVVLKPLSAALRDNDEIYSLVRATGVNQDGRTEGITVPSAAAQEALIREVYARANIEPRHVRYVEAHGTGTPVGDPIEASVIGKTVGANRRGAGACIIGSVKANIGHLEAAAGVAGLIKASLCLKNAEIPPLANLIDPNPQIPFEQLGLRLNTNVEPMPGGEGPAFVGINSFGYGGTNGHALLQEAPALIAPAASEEQPGRAYVLPISARNENALSGLAQSYAALLSQTDACFLDICYSAALRRGHMESRLAVTAENNAEAVTQLEAFVAGQPGERFASGRLAGGTESKPVFVFSGMGPQWWAMGHELLRTEPVFRQTVEACDEAFQKVAGWSILAAMTVPENESRMAETEIAQPANFVLQAGLAALWQSWGIEPAAIVGHSVGEVTAAYVAGALNLEDAVRVSYHRSRLQQTTAGAGRMLAVGLSPASVQPWLKGRDSICIAAVNSPTAVTLSGNPQPLEELAAELELAQIFTSWLRVTVAYHSHQMEPLQEELEASLAGILVQPPVVPLYSTVTGRMEQSAFCDPRYWYRNIRQPVAFADAMDRLVDDGHNLFLEIGPHPVLSSSIGECLMRHAVRGEVYASLRRKEPEAFNLSLALGRLYAAGCSVDWGRRYSGPYRYTKLPSYAWQRERYWSESLRNSEERLGEVVHPLLGVVAPVAGSSWECDLNSHSLAYLADHIIDGVALMPAAAFVEGGLALRAAIDGRDSAVIEDVQLLNALALETSNEVHLQWRFDEKTREYQVHSRVLLQDTQWRHHVTARISPAPPAKSKQLDLPALRTLCREQKDATELYARMRLHGGHYGPRFQTIRELWKGDGEVLANLELSPDLEMDSTPYHVHPSLLDGGFQALIGCLDDGQQGAGSIVYVPVRIRRIQLFSKVDSQCWCYGRVTKVSRTAIEGDILLCNSEGEILAEVQGFRCAALQHGTGDDATQLQRWAYTLKWEEAPPVPTVGRALRWVLFVDESGMGGSLAGALNAHGASEVIQIFAGPTFERLSPTQFQIRRHNRADMQEVLRQADIANSRGLVYLWGIDISEDEADPVGALGTGQALLLIQALAESALPQPPRLYIVTKGAQQPQPGEPVPGLAQAPLAGLGKVTASEYPSLRCTLVDVDPVDFAKAGDNLATEFLGNCDEDDIAWRGERRYVHRVERESTDELEEAAAIRRLLPARDGHAFKLEIGKPGSFDSLRYREIVRRQPEAREVEIKIQTAALNFKDVLKVLGVLPEEVYEHTFHGLSLGMEAAGVVTRVGADVHEYKPGDAIVASLPGSFSSHVYVPVDSLFAVPQTASMTPAEAAGSPVAFMTAYYALHEVARLAPGEKVLIHAATGGVGLAAIQVAHWLGAEVFGTAGSQAKREHLRRLGVKHIWDSRSLDFADGILAATGGRGVDVVLNSISGEALLKSVSVLAPFGRFVEIGKRDIMENTGLPMMPFNRNLSFTAIDLDRMMVDRPDLIRKTLKAVWDRLCCGDFTPIPVKVFSAADAPEAFRYMAQSKQIGKLILDMEDVAGVSIVPRPESETPVQPEATYLITGGFGGIGLELAKWLAAQGARNLVLVGRRGAASEYARQTVAELQGQGVSVMAAAADISQEPAVERLMKDIAETLPPLRGVFHTAAVLDDGLLANLDQERINTSMAPKALGAWLLHQHTRTLPLDFFMLFSSVAAWVGNPGQGNYVAANAFLDALAQKRRAEGLPATSVSWGAIGGVGMVAESDQVAARLASVGIHPLPVASVMSAMARVIRWNPSLLGVMDVDWSRWSQVQPGAKNCRRFSYLLAELESTAGSLDSRSIQIALAALPAEKRVGRLAEGIAELVAKALHMPADKVNLYQPFSEMGIDSLLGVELQTSMSIKIGVEVSILELMKSRGIAALAADLLLKMKLGAADGAETEGAGPAPPDVHSTAVPVASGGTL